MHATPHTDPIKGGLKVLLCCKECKQPIPNGSNDTQKLSNTCISRTLGNILTVTKMGPKIPEPQAEGKKQKAN